MRKNILLPVLDSVRISGYQTYTSTKNGGVLSHDFVDGVNLVVGVNGLGKTTLLRLIHRVIAGPFDLRTPEELGQAQREIKPVRRVGQLFGDRVPDGAKNATAQLVFRLGRDTVSLTRGLDNLKISEFLVNNRPLLAQGVDPESQYQIWITEAFGFGNFFDVLLSLHYLVFFFEDRRSIVWDADAQDELTRLFLYPVEDAKQYRVSFNLAQQADSLARNYQNILNREKKALEKSLSDGTNNHAQDLRLHKSLGERLVVARAGLEETEREHREAVQRQLVSEGELLDLQEKLSEAREAALSSLFPALEDYGAVVISRMQTERLCIVCGSHDHSRIDAAIDTWAKSRECPCCSTPVKLPQFGSGPNEGKNSAAKVDRLHKKRLDLRTSLEEVREKLRTLRERLAEQSTSVAQILAEYEPVNLRVEAAKKQGSKGAITDRIKSLTEGMESAQADRAKNLKKLMEISSKHEKETRRTIDKIAREFDEIIKQLLAERCELSASVVEMTVGEGKSDLRVLAPRFVPMMTSSTSPDTPVPRRTPDAVSESQRDLIDFAFRLAFLRVTAATQPVSVLIDTPEGSLDSVFIPRFAKILQNEGSRTGKGARRFVVTANLTGSPMISNLLKKTGTRKLTAAQQKHVLYLLDQTAASASVRRHIKEYERDFQKAVQAK